jgi:hypothetical protein
MLQGSWMDSAILSHRGKKFRIVQAASNNMYFPSNHTSNPMTTAHLASDWLGNSSMEPMITLGLRSMPSDLTSRQR